MLTIISVAMIVRVTPAFASETPASSVLTDPPPVGRFASAPVLSLSGGDGDFGSMCEILGSGAFKTSLNRILLYELSPGGVADFSNERSCDRIMLVRTGRVSVMTDGVPDTHETGGMLSCPKGTAVIVTNESLATSRLLIIESGGRESSPAASSQDSSPSVAKLLLSREAMTSTSVSHGGRGELLFRRLLNPEAFVTRMWVVSHAVLMPGTTIGYHLHSTREEVYYVLDGMGRLIGNGHVFDLGPDECSVCSTGSAHGIVNGGPGELELLIFSASLVKGEVTGEQNLGDDLVRLIR